MNKYNWIYLHWPQQTVYVWKKKIAAIHKPFIRFIQWHTSNNVFTYFYVDAVFLLFGPFCSLRSLFAMLLSASSHARTLDEVVVGWWVGFALFPIIKKINDHKNNLCLFAVMRGACLFSHWARFLPHGFRVIK